MIVQLTTVQDLALVLKLMLALAPVVELLLKVSLAPATEVIVETEMELVLVPQLAFALPLPLKGTR